MWCGSGVGWCRVPRSCSCSRSRSSLHGLYTVFLAPPLPFCFCPFHVFDLAQAYSRTHHSLGLDTFFSSREKHNHTPSLCPPPQFYSHLLIAIQEIRNLA
ncbi:hypothetical protein VTI74DRAFT_8772 [Chaetomium olivicolor]